MGFFGGHDHPCRAFHLVIQREQVMKYAVAKKKFGAERLFEPRTVSMFVMTAATAATSAAAKVLRSGEPA
jgi:hypothetical protein